MGDELKVVVFAALLVLLGVAITPFLPPLGNAAFWLGAIIMGITIMMLGVSLLQNR